MLTTQSTASRQKRKRPGKGKGPVLSSWKVFMEFVEDKRPCPDVSKVFSQECYQKWLNTRATKTIKHPEKSYQRVLYAHIRGADNRKPFPIHVEKALLKLLRNKKESPLQKLFETGRMGNIGCRGYKQLGFHEQSEESEDKDSGDAETITTVETKDPPPTADLGLKLKVPPALSVTPFDLIMQSFERWMPTQQRNLIMSASLARGIDLMAAPVRFFLQQPPSQMDLRYNFDFLVPSPKEQYFTPNHKIAHFILNKSYICIYEDEYTIELFQGSSLNKHLYEMVGSVVNCLYAKIRSLPEFYRNGKVVWRRSSFRKRDGSLGIFLFKVAENSDGLTYFYIQDISTRHQSLLERPEFV